MVFILELVEFLLLKMQKKLVEVLPKIPREKLIVETDGPYLTPHPFRGKRNEPLYTKYVVEKISELLELEIKEVEKNYDN